jgi:basic membrane protein A and related proteins
MRATGRDHRQRRRLRRVAATAVIAASLLAACGDDDDDAAVDTTGSDVVTETEAPATDAPATDDTAAATAGTDATPASDATTDAATGDPVTVALLLSRPPTDSGWNQQAFESLEALQADGAVEIVFAEPVEDADADRIIRRLAEDGTQLIIGHSYNFGAPIQALAADYPDVAFAWAGGSNGVAENVADYDYPFYQPSYAIGILAGGLTETGTIGFIGGFDIPGCRSQANAFFLGAQSVNPDVETELSWVGDWNDVQRAKESAAAQADAGVDFWQTCDVIQGVTELAVERDLRVIGYVGHMLDTAPDNMVASMIWELEVVFGAMVADVADGSFFPGAYYQLGVQDGAFSIELNPALEPDIPADVVEAFTTSWDDISSGAFEVPYLPTE